MASLLGFFGILALLLGTLALDSEIVVPEPGGPDTTGLNETVKINLKDAWSSNGTVVAQPYNILEVGGGCPPGYVLANKHCHKRA
ncbi:uncharacterized protein LOC122818195 [Drosophila biarmipes]|uniref:uncharacterized protein LOC122818195 n=1 Tax=Drosophila biarmipes TaxID=125945 RepID=UPI001CDA9284|nr:uncharacterized protein LOC122818195 [Drosophila biarmipes]